MTSVCCRWLSATIGALAVSSATKYGEPVLGGTRYRHRGTRRLPAFRFLAGHAVGHLLQYAFLGHQVGSLETGAWCSDIYLGVFTLLDYCLRQPEERFLPLVVLQRVTVPQPPPLPRPGCIAKDHPQLFPRSSGRCPAPSCSTKERA